MIKRFFKYLHSILTINKVYYFKGDQEDLLDVMAQIMQTRKYGFSTRHTIDNTYALSANFSWGVASLALPIKIFFQHKELNEELQEVKLYSKIRLEIWVPLLFFIPLLIDNRDSENYWNFVFLPLLFIFCIAWFNFIFKLQEEALIKKIKKTIGLKEQ